MIGSDQLEINPPNIRSTERVDEFEFEPIKGYPMLNWRGKRPFTSTRYYPAQHKETHGEEVNGWLNKIFWGDNLQVISHLLREYRGKINLAYIDPPFDSNAEYRKKVKLRGSNLHNDVNSFEEKQYTDIWTNDEYLQFIYSRLILIKELLSSTGSLYVHLDWNKGHYIRCLLEEIFGRESLKNEVIWQRTFARSDSKTFNHIHDSIYLCTKSDEHIWNAQFEKHSEEYIKSKYVHVDENGRKYRLADMTSPNPRPNMRYEWRGFKPPENGWRYQESTMQKLHDENRISYPADKNRRPQIKKFLDELEGRPIQSIWTDINPVNSQAIEREGYPTQKPETLLERIIKSSSNPGDLIFDCFMGSGTTQAVAMKLGRRFIGADINLGAVQITTKRLLGVGQELEAQQQQGTLEVDGEEPTTYYTGFEVYNVNNYDVFRNPVQAKELLIEALELNPLDKSNLFDGERDGRMWKIMPVNRIATKADLSELIAGFDYKAFAKRQQEHPKKPVERITLVCMGHDPDLKATLQTEVKPYEIDVEVVDILRDRSDLQFKRDSEAEIVVEGGELVIKAFYPLNLLGKLSIQQEAIEDWREMVESIMVDWNYDGAVLEPKTVDIPGKNDLVQGRYPIPEDAGTIRVKITDLLSESLEMEVPHG
jgi:DNA modification methylase